MKRWPLAVLAAVPLLGAGCGFAQNIRRNVAISPLYAGTDRAEHHRHMKMAREAYRNMALAYPDQEFSCDYREGFVDGFTDYLYNGGVGEPPPVPPPQYRFFGSINAEGLQGMEDWKNGFRHGAATARASKLRDFVTLPVFWGPKFSSDGPAPRQPDPPELLKAPKANDTKDKPPAARPLSDTPPEPVRPK
ncbi:MAG: hypothetical protein K1X57_14675 [Gemmataceae bacterium]|nr:hypothetical protein [Gemmataceae bacterium]